MKQIGIYITEKLKINSDSANSKLSEYSEKQLTLIGSICLMTGICPLGKDYEDFIKENDDSPYIKAIKDWVIDNKIYYVKNIADASILRKHNILDKRLIDLYKDDSAGTHLAAKDLIENGGGKEVLGPSWKDPKIYYNENTLIYHIFDEDNIDMVFKKIN